MNMRNLSFSSKLTWLFTLTLGLSLLIGFIGLGGIKHTFQGLRTVYQDRVIPLTQLKMIVDSYAVDVVDAANKANAGLFTPTQAIESVERARRIIKEQWDAYLATQLTAEENLLIEEAQVLMRAADLDTEKLLGALSALDQVESARGKLYEFDGPLYTTIDPISEQITKLVDLQLRVAGEEYSAAQTRYKRTVNGVVLLIILGGGGMAVVVCLIMRRATRVLTQTAESLSQGALQIASASGLVSSSSQSLAEGASEQAASLEEISSSVEELASMTKRNADNAQSGKTSSGEARAAAESGAMEMEHMQTAMKAIQQSSNDISKIIKTIDEIAFQTNILALNAAVEAARAGEAGAGFAVVADEVRSLAQRSAVAAKETADKIEDATKRSAQGVAISGRVASGLQQILVKAREVDQLVGEVATASQEQSEGISQINMAISQMDKVTQANAATAEETASAAEELNAQSEELRNTSQQLAALVGSKTS